MTLVDILIALVVVTIRGVNFAVIKFGLRDLPSIPFTALRFIFGALARVLFAPRPNTTWPPVVYGFSWRCN
jgi:drug/metabolite transporter (DMT)-like permease